MTARQAGQRFRQRKLSVKQSLPVVREHELEASNLDDEAQRNIPKVETGVEKGEEIEHHLQAVMAATQAGTAASQLFIPTPATSVSGVQYERLYPSHFQQPITYIRFSSTVEDCVGTPYCMTSEDEIFLKQMNANLKRGLQCSEDEFEQVMSFFEETSAAAQPFASVDRAEVLKYEQIEAHFEDEEFDVAAQRFAKEIYPYWKSLRVNALNHPLMPTLKSERSEGTDDSDPYVCFRRREVRQVRKTRGRDAQIAEKLKKLRSELEMARHLIDHVKRRESCRRQQLVFERQIFEQRALVKESKRNLQIKGDDEDLINQKPVPKPRPKLDPAIIQRGAMHPGMIPKAPLAFRADGRPPDSDLLQLADEKARTESEINQVIQDSMNKHRVWNTDWVDNTWIPLIPDDNDGRGSSFRAATTEFLPTPPASISEAEDTAMIDGGRTPNSIPEKSLPKLPMRFASPPLDPAHGMTIRPAYRRRAGRGGRLFIDRRGLKRACPEEFGVSPLSPVSSTRDERERERTRYDVESDEESEVYHTDPYDDWNIKYRMAMQASPNRNGHEQVIQHQRMLEEQQKRQNIAAMAGVSGARATLPVGR